jgi:hypothetical protein
MRTCYASHWLPIGMTGADGEVRSGRQSDIALPSPGTSRDTQRGSPRPEQTLGSA